MKTLIINDYRYLRSVLLFWLGLLLLPVLCLAGLHTPLGWSPYYWSSITYAISLLFLAQIITQAVLVSNLVQKENLKNPHAYWLTRPIPRGQLVAAKFISTALWFLLPQFLQIGLMALLIPSGLRTPSGILGPVAIPVVLVLCASLVVAGLSRTSGKALMGLTMIPVGLIITDIAGMYFIRIPLQSGLLRILGDSFSVESLLIGLVVILSLGGYTLRYFSHRYRSASAFCLGLAALCLVLTIGLEDPPRIPEATMQLPDEATLRVDGINFLRKWGRDNEFGLVSSGQRSGPAAVWDDDDGGKSYGISAQGARIQLNNSRLLIEEIHRRGTTISITFRFIGVLPIPGVAMEEAGLFALYDPSTGAASFAEHRESYASDALGLLTTGSFELNFRNLDRLEHPEGPLELYFVHLDLLGIDVRRVDYRVHR